MRLQPYPVEVADPTHWLVADIEPFDTDDELYLMEYHDRDALQPLLQTRWQGDGPSRKPAQSANS